ncbi:MAG: hypothetical protein KAS32_04190 [Candidatus Peribacteraceae bacterium]|nr:hypothetical protein [Candidatus Peribacteraceae bacterium]
MKKYKHIYFTKSTQIQAEKPIYECRNNKSKEIIAVIYWYPQWKQFVFGFYEDAVFSQSCLLDIVDFIKDVSNEKT